MRILHLSDLHIGKSLYDTNLIEDQAHALEQAKALARDGNVDVVAITGDVYDRAVPPVEAQDLLDELLVDLVSCPRIHVIVIPGNHDSPERLSFAHRLLGPARVHIARGGRRLEPLVLRDAHGEVTFYPAPYISPGEFREHAAEERKSFTEIYEALFESLPTELSARSVCLAHCFTTGGIPTGDTDERSLYVGGSQFTDPAVFDRFSLTLLGHLHRPQRVNDRIWYAGSLLPYSFNDGAGAKSFAVYDLGADGAFTREEIAVRPRRRIGRLAATLDEGLASRDGQGPSSDLLEISLLDEQLPPSYVDRVKAAYPQSLVRWSPPSIAVAADGRSLDELRHRSDEQVVRDFFAAVGEQLSDDELALLDEVVNTLADEARAE